MVGIDVEVRFFSPANGGRKVLPDLFCGTYRPHFLVEGRPKDEYLGVQFICQKSKFSSNLESIATVRLVYSGIDYSALEKGALFEIMEGATQVGIGKVL